jgi:hypothetical protein
MASTTPKPRPTVALRCSTPRAAAQGLRSTQPTHSTSGVAFTASTTPPCCPPPTRRTWGAAFMAPTTHKSRLTAPLHCSALRAAARGPRPYPPTRSTGGVASLAATTHQCCLLFTHRTWGDAFMATATPKP